MAGTRLACSVLALTLGLCGAAGAVTAPAGSGQTVVVAVTGHISPKCTLDTSRASSTDFGDITDRKTGSATDATLDLPFDMTCNTPYVATLASRNGGLIFQGSPVAEFASSVGYSAQLAMGEIAGGVSLSCSSSQMRVDGGDGATGSACKATSADTLGATSGEGRVKLRLQPGAQPLLKGVYQDELIVNLSPVVSG